MAGGRPSDFTPEIANEICERLGKGESLKSITSADRDDFMPCESTVRNWLARGDGGEEPFCEFLRQYARAREVQADTYAAEVVEIADQPNKVTKLDGTVIENDPQRDRLRIDARKWYAGKLAPKKYGDKIAHVGGGEDDAPIKTKVDLSGLSVEQLTALAAIPTG